MLTRLTETDIKLLIEFANNNMNVSQTSKHEYLHRNTIVYHLKKVKRMTGLNPFNFYELIQLMELAGVITIKCKYFKLVGEDK
jgi:carbohydrate diacid regulator